MATISLPSVIPPPAVDAEQLQQAFAGWGTNEGKIVAILAHRNAEQRTLIRNAYAKTYGEDLLKSLDQELSQDFEKLVLLWTFDPAERDAFLANAAVRRWNPSDRVLIEIACARSSSELIRARQAYHERFKKSLEEDVAFHATGDIRKLLLPLITAYRYEGTEVDTRLAKSEATILHDKISDKAYSDEELIRIISTRSKIQLAATFNQYIDHFGNPILKDLEGEDEYVAALAAAVQLLSSPEEYFENVLRQAINKWGTDEGALTRVVSTRAEVDLAKIGEAYFKRNSVALADAVAADTSGDYQDMLLALLGARAAP